MPTIIKRKRTNSQDLQFATLAGRKVVLAPIFGEDGKFQRFLIDRRTVIPVHDPDRDEVYLRVD